MDTKAGDAIVSLFRHRRLATSSALACVFAAVSAQLLPAEQRANVLAQASSGPLHCEIQKDDKGDMVELIGVAASTRSLAGSAQLILGKSGPSGVSSADQSDDFNLQADQPTTVVRATTSLRFGGHVVVVLRLRGDGLECRTQAELDR